jgi:hypothetical protein
VLGTGGIIVDRLSSRATPRPGLLENIERLRLEPSRIIAVHYPADGRVVTKEELMKAAGRSGSTSQ